jgi:hypothetical protein
MALAGLAEAQTRKREKSFPTIFFQFLSEIFDAMASFLIFVFHLLCSVFLYFSASSLFCCSRKLIFPCAMQSLFPMVLESSMQLLETRGISQFDTNL